LKPWLKKQWCIPPKENAEFAWKMEDVLDVYKRPYDSNRPMVCLDETSKQLIGETRTPVSAMPGREARYDHEYQRNGTANLFMVFEPLAGRRHVKVTERRTKKDWAGCVGEMVDEMYPAAERIVLVMDNLNTHTPASLYEAFPPREAKRIADRLEIHYTPKHGSWLDMAEIELGILGRQCLDRRIDNAEALTREVAAWEAERNAAKAKVDWRFTTDDARIKLKKLYPSIEE
jgi:hypothetical protein